jgi:putative MATE family efflux protein
VSDAKEAQAPARRAKQRGWRDRDHTRGSLFVSLLMLALPLLASSVLGGVVFQLVDLTFLSRLGEAPMAAVIIVNQTLRQLLMLLLMGGSFGSQALIARAVGEGNIDRAEQVAGQLVLLGAGFASLVALVGLLFPELLFSLPGPDPSFYPHGVPYLRLLYVLSFGLVGTQCFIAILVGAGDTTTPFLVILTQTAVAIFAEWVLIFGNLGAPALGVRGAALGIASGQIVAMAIGLSVLFRGRARVHLRGRHLVPNPALMREILMLSWPPAIQMGAAVVMTFAYVRLAGMFGESVQAAYAIGLRLGMIAPMVCFPLATAGATLVGQALGSGSARRAWRAIGVALMVHGAVMWSFALGVFLFRSEILGLFSDDPKVIEVGAEYLLYLSGAFALWAFHFVFMRALHGAGDMLVPMGISLASTFLVSIPLAAFLSLGTDLGHQGLWIAFLATNVFATLAMGLRVATGRWSRRAAHSGPGPEPS